MDHTLRTQARTLRRRAHAEPQAALALARQLQRADQLDAAREVLAERLASGHLETQVLEALAGLGWQTGRLTGAAREERPWTHVDLLAGRRRGLSRGPSPVVPGIAVAGQGAYELAQALLRGLPCAGQARAYRCAGETHIAFQLRLPTPWTLAPGYTAAAVRLFTVPLGPESLKLRRRLLRSTSALFLAPGASEADLAQLDGLTRAFRRVHGRSPTAFPLVCTRRVELPGFDRETCALGEDLLEALAYLLLEIGRGVRGFVRPR